MTQNDDARWMRLALSLGARGMGRVWPNPAVGCVIVRAGRVVGRGWTAPGGRPHAETKALAEAGDAARGATAYVTLEPCAHQGRTPPCAEALVAAGVARVVTALEDPDPRVAGAGHARLSAAGIEVTTGVGAEAAARDHRGFLTRVTAGRPAVTLKLAASLDGRIATASGESRWITGPGARRLVHAMRARHDAVLIGAGTARADNPDLTVRDLGVAHQPVRVICDTHLSLPVESRLGQSAGAVPVWLCCGEDAPASARDAWAAAGARLLPCAVGPDGRLDLSDMLAELGREGLTRVFVEGGGEIAAGLIRAGFADEIVTFTAGLVLGADGRPAVGAMGLTALADAPRLRLVETCVVAGDVMQRWERPV